MPKKRVNPLIKCLDYFRDATLIEAQLALTIAADLVQRRMIDSGEVKPRLNKKKASRLSVQDEARSALNG